MIMLISLLFITVICAMSLVACSSPYLPHNSIKYIPQLSYQGEQEAEIAMETEESLV